MLPKLTVILFAVVMGPFAIAGDASRRTGVLFDKPTTLDEAVLQFNAQVNRISEIGRQQPPLTVDEVIAAIRSWDTNAHPIQPELHLIFQRIAESKLLPAGSELEFTSGWRTKRFDYKVWWVKISVSAPNPEQDDSRVGYSFLIRDRKISSRLASPRATDTAPVLTDAERQRHIAEYLSTGVDDDGDPQ